MMPADLILLLPIVCGLAFFVIHRLFPMNEEKMARCWVS